MITLVHMHVSQTFHAHKQHNLSCYKHVHVYPIETHASPLTILPSTKLMIVNPVFRFLLHMQLLE